MSDWPVKPITDIVDFNPPRKIKKGSVAPFIDMASLPMGAREISEVGEREFKGSGSKFQNGDTLFARITPCLENGKTAKVTVLNEGDVAHGSTEFIVMSAKDKQYDEEFVYYIARMPEFRNYAQSRMEGTSGRQRVPWQALATYELPIPPKEIRKQIGDILSSIDDKIELNRQMNQTLEQIAQAIFKSWFVDFEPVKAKIEAKEELRSKNSEFSILNSEFINRAAMRAISGKTDQQLDQLSAEQRQQLATTAALFPDELEESELGKIPKGWDVGVVGDFIEFNPKRVLKKGVWAPYLDMKNMPTEGHIAQEARPRVFGSGTKFINGDALLARITPCLENGKTAFVDFLEENEVAWGSTEYIVMHSKDDYPESIAYFMARHESFRQFAIQNMMGTSGRQRASADALANMPWVIPERSVAQAFGKFSTVFMARIKSNGDSSKTIANIRDSLLPKILSGEITLGDTQSTAEVVA